MKSNLKNKRLLTIADCVLKGSILADIGTDHAYLPVHLVQTGTIQKAYACDIAEGPLQSAKETISQAHLQEQIETILCPGLQKLPCDVNSVVIAGMGWMTAQLILENDFEKLSQLDQVLIQVNRDVAYLRQWLVEHEFEITLEKVVYDRFYYTIIGFNPKQKKAYTLSPKEILYGPILSLSPDEECRNYYRFLIDTNQKILQGLQTESEKAKELLEQNQMLNEILES